MQKLGGGTTCDLTRKERKIEVQVSSVVRHTLGLGGVGLGVASR